MEKYVKRLYIIVVLLAVSVIIWSFINESTGLQKVDRRSDLILLEDQWEKLEDENAIIYKKKLAEENMYNKAIMFHTSHQTVQAYIDNELIYYNGPTDNRMIKTTGYRWQCIPLKNAYQGKTLLIKVSVIYNIKGKRPQMYYGESANLICLNMDKYLLSYITSNILIFIGCVIYIYIFFNSKERTLQKSLFYLALFSVLLGFWRMGELPITSLFISESIIFVLVNHISLMSIPLAFFLFFKNLYSKDDFKIGDSITLISTIIIFIRLVCQMFGIYDLRETLVLTHWNILLVALGIFAQVINRLIHKEYKKEEISRCIMMILISVVTAMSLIAYNYKGIIDDSGVIVFLIYIISVAIGNMKKLRHVENTERKLEIYQRLAYQDSLTKTYNRTAFQNDIDKYDTADKASNLAIFMIDLNNLKKCNDIYGHQLGDEYLTMVAREIYYVFSDIGNIYRIGGDEFCILTKSYVDTAFLEIKIEKFKERIEELNKKGFVIKVSAAIGYSIFNKEIDQTVLDTKNRADQRMYACKRIQKLES